MEIMSSPWPLISLIKADPPAVIRYETCTGSPCEFFPSQEPERDFSWSNDFCASDCAKTAAVESVNSMQMANTFIFFLRNSYLCFAQWALSFSYSASTKVFKFVRLVCQNTR